MTKGRTLVETHRIPLLAVTLSAALAANVAFGRGERWIVKPPVPPPVETLTNEARYIEWKFREDVTDPSTGLATAAVRAKITALRKELEPKKDWRVVKAIWLTGLWNGVRDSPLRICIRYCILYA